MAILYVGIDLAKNMFAVHGVDEYGKPALVRPKVARDKLHERVAALPPCTIGMEACSGVHHWARLFGDLGHAARAALADPRHPVAVRCEAIRCLAECGDAKDSNALLQALGDVDSGVRAAASAALARLGGEPVLQHLERSKSVDGTALRPVLRAVLPKADGRLLASAEQRQAALPVYLEQREVAALVRHATATDGEAAARLSAIAALGRLGGEAAQTALQGILANKSEDGAIRAIAFKSLRRLERRTVNRVASGG